MFYFDLPRLQKCFGAIISVGRFKSCSLCLDHRILCATKRRERAVLFAWSSELDSNERRKNSRHGF